MNVLPDKKIFELVARQLGISESFVEKDWYVTQALSIISQINHSDFQLVFSGGTALSKAHQLIQRFSEDIDFLIIAPKEFQNRKDRSHLKKKIVESLKSRGFQITDKHIKARNDNRFIGIDLDYKTNFDRSHSLRPHLQIEMTFKTTQLPTIEKSVSSFVAQLSNKPAEVESIDCLDPVENAADKLSGLTWRVLDRDRNSPYDDPALVRHIHDLAMLKDMALNHTAFSSLVTVCMEQDKERFKSNSQFSNALIPEKLTQLLQRLETDTDYEMEYDQFVKGVSYAATDSTPSFVEAVGAIKDLIGKIK